MKKLAAVLAVALSICKKDEADDATIDPVVK